LFALLFFVTPFFRFPAFSFVFIIFSVCRFTRHVDFSWCSGNFSAAARRHAFIAYRASDISKVDRLLSLLPAVLAFFSRRFTCHTA